MAHITHRCHKREFLLKFARDQPRWLHWLFEAKKRLGTSILNHALTSNHIHLVLMDDKGEEVISEAMQLIAGRTGQESNQRKNRKGAFWDDHYHATAVEGETHLSPCMVYIGVNMVRAGVGAHPSEWPFCGYNEIQSTRQRYSLIDSERLMDLFGIRNMEELKERHRGWVEEALEKQSYWERQPRWAESIAIGSEGFVRDTKERLGARAKWREIVRANGSYELRDPPTAYGAEFGLENAGLRQENAFYWDMSY
ncbi:MAG: transposase [Deltaproteobacteria bacterium]|nr:transposase [Deltaproteobacteria bacterium]